MTRPMHRRHMIRILGGTLAATGALSAGEPRITVQPYNTLTDEDEIELGRIYSGELEKSLDILDVGPLTSYMTNAVQRLGKVSQRPNMPYQMKVVNDSAVNAFAIPGGYLYANRGLLEWANNESELISVLSHEVGHVVGRHGANQFSRRAHAKQLYDLLKKSIGINENVVIDIIEKMGGALVILAEMQFSQADELQADKLGLYQMQRAGWNPNGMLTFFERLRAQEKDPGLLEGLLSTHPPTRDRAAAVAAELKVMPKSSGLSENSFAFLAMKTGLQLLPAAPKQQRRARP